jgi:hypothetical protein
MLRVSVVDADELDTEVLDADDLTVAALVSSDVWCSFAVANDVQVDAREVGVIWCDVTEELTAGVAAVSVSGASIGDISSVVVEVSLSDAVVSVSSDYALGVTITVNAAVVSIVSAILQGGSMRIRYELATPIDADDVIVFAYSDAVGDLQTSGGIPVASIGATSVTNDVGEHLYFDEPADAVHIASV